MMKTSELIKALEAMKETFGDLPVYHVDEDFERETNTVTRKDAYKYGNYEFPERIELDE